MSISSKHRQSRIIGLVLLSILSSYGKSRARSLDHGISKYNAKHLEGAVVSDIKKASTGLGMDAPYFEPMGYPSQDMVLQNDPGRVLYNAAYGSDQTRVYYGVKALLDVYEIRDISPTQTSGAAIRLTDGTTAGDGDVIAVGWAVSPTFYHDNHAHLTIEFNAKGKGGCYNLLCPGFTQTHQTIKPGMILNGGTALGERKQITLMVSLDPNTHDWVLSFGYGNGTLESVGFWKNGFFKSMLGSCAGISLGGFAGGYRNIPSPAMGSGHIPGDAAAAGIYRITFINSTNQMYNPIVLLDYVDRSSAPAYDVSELYGITSDGCRFYYGGQGGLTS